MTQLGRTIVLIGAAMMVIGLAVWGLGRLGFRGLPGDLRHESGNVRFYFPIVTCIVVSVVLTLLMWLWQWMMRR
jgi:hypothetical protein